VLIFVQKNQYINQWAEKQEVAIVTLNRTLNQIMYNDCRG